MDVSERLLQNTTVNAKNHISTHYIHIILSRFARDHNISLHSSRNVVFALTIVFFTTFSHYLNRELYNLT